MSDNFNPIGTNGFAFIEFTTINHDLLSGHFSKLGFIETGKSGAVTIYQQGKIKLILNPGTDNNTKAFAALHGDSACAMGFYVCNPTDAFITAINRGAKAYPTSQESIWYGVPAICGIGGSAIYLVSTDDEFLQRFTIDKNIIDNKIDCGLMEIDHLTHNVYRGNLNKWADFYSSIFNFREIRYFDIDGKLTGLLSKAMASPCDKIRIPLNESKDNKSQIEEFLIQFNGEGIQHIAFSANDIYQTVIKIKQNGLAMLDTPDTYYELLATRLGDHGEDLKALQANKILLDGVTIPKRKLLLQIFTQNLLGPSFFEIIQRKGDDGFGEGNFQALFDSIELDQLRRGVI